MNYYIDFDNTLYETSKLTQTILGEIASIISNKTGKNQNEILDLIKSEFDSGKDNMYTYSDNLSEKYGLEKGILAESIKNILSNGKGFVYSDSENFLERLKSTGNRIILFTYLPKTNQEYQLQKINGSGLAKYFDLMIFTTELKHTIDLEYQNGIFIDDNAEVLEGLSSKNPLKLIRIRRVNAKYSNIDIKLENMEEYAFLDNIPLDFDK